MYDRAKEQQKEIATIKERTIHLNLSDADCKRISTYAAKANITVSQLLESFIGDLVNGTYTNGSDERDYCYRAHYNKLIFHFSGKIKEVLA